MSYRTPVSPVKDQNVFKHTADKTKKINISPTVMRGGTRL